MNNISYFSYPKYICLVKKIIYDHLIYVMYDLHALSLSLVLFIRPSSLHVCYVFI